MIKLWVDFNNATYNGWVRFNCKGTIDDLENQNIILREGLELLLWTEDEDEYNNPIQLSVEAVAHFNDKDKTWEGKCDMKNIIQSSLHKK